MEMEQRDFFISYANEDEERAKWATKALKDSGKTVYVQYKDSPPGDSFVFWINDALGKSSNFIAIWSEAYAKSEHCKSEMGAAYALKAKKLVDKFLLVRFEDVQMGPLFSTYGRADLFGLDETQREKEFLRAIKRGGAVHKSDSHIEASVSGNTSTIASKLIRLRSACSSILSKASDYFNLLPKGISAVAGGLLGALIFSCHIIGYLVFIFGFILGCVFFPVFYHMNTSPASAMDSLGVIYYTVDNYEEAKICYEKASEAGDVNAIRHLGVLYEYGLAIEPDTEKALEYYTRAAEMGNEKAKAAMERLKKRLTLSDAIISVEENSDSETGS